MKYIRLRGGPSLRVREIRLSVGRQNLSLFLVWKCGKNERNDIKNLRVSPQIVIHWYYPYRIFIETYWVFRKWKGG